MAAPLTDFPRSSTVRVSRIAAGHAHRLRLAELGLRDGAVVTVRGKAAGGAFVLDIAGAPIALDRRTARAITAEATS